MSKYRTPPRYDVSKAIGVNVGDRQYFAFLDGEIVVTSVARRNGKAVLRRVTSRQIETTALLLASDMAHAA